ncbi:hypothetical protein AgCh_002080 [Apium graveolens]
MLMQQSVRLSSVKYLKHTLCQGDFFSSDAPFTFTVHVDADWEGCHIIRQSLTSYCVSLGDSAISWKSKKHVTVSRFSADEEYRALANVSYEVTWLVNLLSRIRMSKFTPVQHL